MGRGGQAGAPSDHPELWAPADLDHGGRAEKPAELSGSERRVREAGCRKLQPLRVLEERTGAAQRVSGPALRADRIPRGPAGDGGAGRGTGVGSHAAQCQPHTVLALCPSITPMQAAGGGSPCLVPPSPPHPDQASAPHSLNPELLQGAWMAVQMLPPPWLAAPSRGRKLALCLSRPDRPGCRAGSSQLRGPPGSSRSIAEPRLVHALGRAPRRRKWMVALNTWRPVRTQNSPLGPHFHVWKRRPARALPHQTPPLSGPSTALEKGGGNPSKIRPALLLIKSSLPQPGASCK